MREVFKKADNFLLCDKAVQNMFNCAFPIFWSIFQKLWIFHQEKFLLGRRKLRRPRRNLVLGTGIFSGPKKGIVLGRRKLRRPRKNSFQRHIQSFWKRSKKIGNAQLNVFCTAFIQVFKGWPKQKKISYGNNRFWIAIFSKFCLETIAYS